MAFIKISNLNSAGTDLFASAESFLTELQPTDLTQIVGGGGYGCHGKKKNSYKKDYSYEKDYSCEKDSYKKDYSYEKNNYKKEYDCYKPCYTPPVKC
jgi:hypothetical protein